jgi:hypothetical protein
MIKGAMRSSVFFSLSRLVPSVFLLDHMRTSHRPHFVWKLSALDNMRSSICPGPFSILIVNYKPLAAYLDLCGNALVHDGIMPYFLKRK